MVTQKVAYDPSWTSAADAVDQATVETPGHGYPLIQWVNGDPKARRAGGVPYTGGWFLNAEQAPADVLPGWEPGELVHGDGGATTGWFARDVTVAILHRRRCWRVLGGDRPLHFAWSQYEEARRAGRPSGRLQVLSLVRSLEAAGPFVLTMKGSTSQAFAGSREREGVLGAFHRLVIQPANLLHARAGGRARFPWRAFWLTVGPERAADDTPRFTEAGTKPSTSMVTLPVALGLVDPPGAEDLFRLFVGRERLEALNAQYLAAEAWAKAWDVALPPALSPQQEAPASSAGDALDGTEELLF